MIWLLIFYFVPVILNSILFFPLLKELQDCLPEISDARFAYICLVFMPAINLFALIYFLYDYVCELSKKD